MAKHTGTVRERLVAIVALELDLTHEEIVDESEIERDLGADSLDRTALASEIEDEFEVSVQYDHEQRWVTFGDMLASVEQLVADRA